MCLVSVTTQCPLEPWSSPLLDRQLPIEVTLIGASPARPPPAKNVSEFPSSKLSVVSTMRPQRYAGKENENASNIGVNIKSRKQPPLSPLKQQSLHHTNVQSKKQKLNADNPPKQKREVIAKVDRTNYKKELQASASYCASTFCYLDKTKHSLFVLVSFQ